MRNAVLITGADGGIGTALVECFKASDWYVIGVTLSGEPIEGADCVLACDIIDFVRDESLRAHFLNKVSMSLPADRQLSCLINNAAVQILDHLEDISLEDWDKSIYVNLTAPMLMAQALLDFLIASKGSILNVGSVHQQATKRKFVTYSMTKAALAGLTRAMAIDLSGKVRVVCIAPAATQTPMLEAGFEGRPEAFKELSKVHPSGRIAAASEIAEVAEFLASEKATFINGTTIYIDGGILSRLHDPE